MKGKRKGREKGGGQRDEWGIERGKRKCVHIGSSRTVNMRSQKSLSTGRCFVMAPQLLHKPRF